MNSKLPILAVLVGAAALLGIRYATPYTITGFISHSVGPVPAGPAKDRGRVPKNAAGEYPSSADENQTTRAQDVIANASRNVFRYESIHAKIRLRIRLFDQNLVGKGEYFQLGPNEDKLLRLDLQIPIADKVTRLQQVCDGRFLWQHQDMVPVEYPGQPATELSRVDLYHVREAVNARATDATEKIAAGDLIRCGLAHLLRELAANFDFYKTGVTTLSDIPMWVVHGRWKQENLLAVMPEHKDVLLAGKPLSLDLPSHLADEVVVTLGRHDSIPYRVEFVRHAEHVRFAATDQSPGRGTTTMVLMELFEVAIGDLIDPRQFQYKPNDLEVDDRTDEYLQRLRLSAIR